MKNSLIEIKMPWLSPDEPVIEVVQWLVAKTETVSMDQDLVELDVEGEEFVLPSPIDGILREILALPGDLLTPGQVIARIEEI